MNLTQTTDSNYMRSTLSLGRSDSGAYASVTRADFPWSSILIHPGLGRQRLYSTLKRLIAATSDTLPEGMSPPNNCIVDAVRTTLRDISETKLALAVLVPTANGGLQLEWHSPGKILEMEFVSGMKTQYLKYERGGVSDEGEFSVGGEETLSSLLDWFFAA